MQFQNQIILYPPDRVGSTTCCSNSNGNGHPHLVYVFTQVVYENGQYALLSLWRVVDPTLSGGFSGAFLYLHEPHWSLVEYFTCNCFFMPRHLLAVWICMRHGNGFLTVAYTRQTFSCVRSRVSLIYRNHASTVQVHFQLLYLSWCIFIVFLVLLAIESLITVGLMTKDLQLYTA